MYLPEIALEVCIIEFKLEHNKDRIKFRALNNRTVQTSNPAQTVAHASSVHKWYAHLDWTTYRSEHNHIAQKWRGVAPLVVKTYSLYPLTYVARNRVHIKGEMEYTRKFLPWRPLLDGVTTMTLAGKSKQSFCYIFSANWHSFFYHKLIVWWGHCVIVS